MIGVLLLILAIAVAAALHLHKHDAAGICRFCCALAHEDDAVDGVVVGCTVFLPAALPEVLNDRRDSVDTDPSLDAIASGHVFPELRELPVP